MQINDFTDLIFESTFSYLDDVGDIEEYSVM